MTEKNVFFTQKLLIVGMLTIGGILLAYALFHNKSNATMSEWVPVNSSLKKALETMKTTEDTDTNQSTKDPNTKPSVSTANPTQTSHQDTSPSLSESKVEPKSEATTSPKLTIPIASEQPDSNSAIIDLNHATQAELETLPGIGPSKAQAIISYRQQKSGFSSVKQLLEVKGIGPKMLDRISTLIRVSKPE
ncbi:ComEA family DNA-binding protein [Cohnella sp.]|uniref:ComEA family DNA-binding protein n=1 Tax=Cohnella sp. TaxID=1883426 RepID=UPI003567A6FA